MEFNIVNYVVLFQKNVNVIFTVVGLFDKIRNYNKKNIKNYIEIYIKTDIKKLKIKSNKKHYKNKIKMYGA